MFEEKTYQYLLAQALTRAPSGIDTRQGSIYRDSLAGQMLVLASAYVDLDNLIKLMRIDTAEGEYLDDLATLFNLERNAATLATYRATLTAVPGAALSVPEETQFFAEELYFDLYYDSDEQPYFECETPGTVGNYIQSGTAANPVMSVMNLASATFGEIITAAVDTESDEDFRERLKLRIRTLSENGNKEHYKTWCEQVEGVGHARIVPLWNGPNTVKGVIFGTDGGAASADVVAAVQAYVDPATLGHTATVDGVTYVVGDGLGEGAANLGAHFTAVAPTTITVNVSATLLLAAGADIDECKARITAALTSYLGNLERDSNYGATIRYYQISSIIMDDESVLDLTDLEVNGSTANIQLTSDQVSTLGTVTFTEGGGD